MNHQPTNFTICASAWGVMLWLHDAGFPVDTVEALPTERNVSFISVGTYLYDENTKTRSGDLRIMKMDFEKRNLETIQTIQGPGVLDVKWLASSGGKCKGVWARSDGSLCIGDFDELSENILNVTTLELEPEAITMACDISNDKTLVASAMSSGSVIVQKISTAQTNSVSSTDQKKIAGHSLEAWTVTFDRHHSHLLHSGGDDAKWRAWDLSSNTAAFTCSWHTAGVCSIQPHPVDENLIATGSYDKHAALWDRRTMKQPLKSIKVESGVWKLRWHPAGDMRILAACMYDGFHVFEMSDGRIESKYDPGALSYGCSWCTNETAVTCSFYNNQIQVWEPKDKKHIISHAVP